jgi:hypothetical protein
MLKDLECDDEYNLTNKVGIAYQNKLQEKGV